MIIRLVYLRLPHLLGLAHSAFRATKKLQKVVVRPPSRERHASSWLAKEARTLYQRGDSEEQSNLKQIDGDKPGGMYRAQYIWLLRRWPDTFLVSELATNFF